MKTCSSTLMLAVLLAVSCKSSDKDEQQAAGTAGRAAHDGGAQGAAGTAGAGEGAPAADGTRAGAGGQWYHASFVGEDGVEIPFYLQLPARPNEGTAIVATGEQHIEGSCRWYGNEATVNLPLLRTRMFLRQSEDGALGGHMMTQSPVVIGTASLSIRATPVPAPDEAKRFSGPGTCSAPADPSAGEEFSPFGEWLVSFEGMGAAELILEQEAPNVATASFRFSDGVVVFLAGNVFDGCIRLSGFDGVNPFLVTIQADPASGSLLGRWIGRPGLDQRAAFTAERREGVDIGSTGVLFVPNRTSLALFELGLPQYRGKPVIIEFGASWCPPCLDSIPLLRELYAEHHEEGLEIVTLLFELLDDEDKLRRQAELFVEKFDIPWQIVPVRGAIEPYWDVVPHDMQSSEVNLPVTLFINADGTIRDVHMGFPHPESGPYQDVVERYQRLARELVAGE